jgi:hypothetical protein
VAAARVQAAAPPVRPAPAAANPVTQAVQIRRAAVSRAVPVRTPAAVSQAQAAPQVRTPAPVAKLVARARILPADLQAQARAEVRPDLPAVVTAPHSRRWGCHNRAKAAHRPPAFRTRARVFRALVVARAAAKAVDRRQTLLRSLRPKAAVTQRAKAFSPDPVAAPLDRAARRVAVVNQAADQRVAVVNPAVRKDRPVAVNLVGVVRGPVDKARTLPMPTPMRPAAVRRAAQELMAAVAQVAEAKAAAFQTRVAVSPGVVANPVMANPAAMARQVVDSQVVANQAQAMVSPAGDRRAATLPAAERTLAQMAAAVRAVADR